MDSDKVSTQVGRLEVIETGRRRRWSEDEKLKIVLENLQAPRQVAATARRHGISRSLLPRWRQLFRPEKDAAEQPMVFVPAKVVPDPGGNAWSKGVGEQQGNRDRVRGGARMRITGAVDAATLAAAVAALAGGRAR